MIVCTPYTYMNRYIDFVIIIREGDGLSKMIDYDNTHEQGMKDLMISYLDKMKSLIDLVLYLGTQISIG